MHPNERKSEARFAGFRYIEARRRLVRDDGTEVTLRPKSLATFRLLAGQSDRVVERETLHRAIWGRTVVTDDSLGKCIAEIRHAIGDTAHEVLRTVPRHGYMLVADRPAAVGARAASVTPPASVADGTRVVGRWPHRALATALVVALALAHHATREPTAFVTGPLPSDETFASSVAAPGALEESAAGAASTVPVAMPLDVGGTDGATPATSAGDATTADASGRDGRLPTVSLHATAPDDPAEGASLDALVGAVRATLGRHRSVSHADADYRLSVALRGRGANGGRCVALELADARGTVVFADAYPIDDAAAPYRRRGRLLV